MNTPYALIFATLVSVSAFALEEPTCMSRAVLDGIVKAEHPTLMVGQGLDRGVWAFSGSTQKSIQPNQWPDMARGVKASILSALAHAGWEPRIEVKSEPTGKMAYSMHIVASRGPSMVAIDLTVFLPRGGVCDLAFAEVHRL